MDADTIPADAWRYTSPQDATRKLVRISRSKKHLDAFMEYVKTCDRIESFRNRISFGELRVAKLGIPSEVYGPMDLEAIYQRQQGRCFYCHETLGDDCETDHKRALSRGGPDALSNIVLACQKCNRSKRTKTPKEFSEWKAKRDQPTLFSDTA